LPPAPSSSAKGSIRTRTLRSFPWARTRTARRPSSAVRSEEHTLNSSLDAGVDDPPDTAKLEAKGLRALVDVAALKLPTANTVLAAQRSWVKDHKDIAQRYVDSLVQAIALANKDRSRSVSAMKKYFKSSDEQALGSASDFFTKEVIPALPYPTVEQFADAKTVLGAKNPKVRTYEVATLLDPSFVKSAENRNLHR